MDYVPADIVKMLFEQSKNAIDANTTAITKMTESVNELAKVMAAPPTKRDILDEIKEHENHCGNRVKETCEKLENIVDDEEKLQANKKLEDEKRHNVITNGLGTIQGKVNAVHNRVLLMIAVVLIAFSLISITYIYVNNSVNSAVKSVLESHIEKENRSMVHQEAPNAPK